jgi:hypothetical protein
LWQHFRTRGWRNCKVTFLLRWMSLMHSAALLLSMSPCGEIRPTNPPPE